MKKTTVMIPWKEGLHLRPATKLVKLAQSFHSQMTLKLGSVAADATSILSVLVLCASLNSVVEVEAEGLDELDAIAAIEEFFDPSADLS